MQALREIRDMEYALAQELYALEMAPPPPPVSPTNRHVARMRDFLDNTD